MPFLTVVLLFAGYSLADGLSMVAAQSSFQELASTTATLSPLGGNEAIYSNAHANEGATHHGSGLPSNTFSSPTGALPRTVTPFGTPAPPSLLTPAPLLPIQPKGMATPQPRSPAASGASSGSGSFDGPPARR